MRIFNMAMGKESGISVVDVAAQLSARYTRKQVDSVVRGRRGRC